MNSGNYLMTFTQRKEHLEQLYKLGKIKERKMSNSLTRYLIWLDKPLKKSMFVGAARIFKNHGWDENLKHYTLWNFAETQKHRSNKIEFRK